MKKISLLLCTGLISLISCSNPNNTSSTTTSSEDETTTSEIEQTPKEKYKLKRENSYLADSNFNNGFTLISPKSTDQHLEKVIDYNGEADKDYNGDDGSLSTYWTMCQWWTPYNFKDAEYTKINGVHHYENESRMLEVDPKQGSITMELDSYVEYQKRFGGPLPGNEPWAHFLIQQQFPNSLQFNPSTIDNLHVSFDIKVNEAIYKGANETPYGKECAQLLLYLRLTNKVPSDSDPNEVGKPGQSMWFGIPIFDSRYDSVPEYKANDEGFEGATNSMIYSIASASYMGPKFEIGKQYTIDIDVMESLKQAFIYGVTNDYMPNCKWENLTCYYMNFGWELPGEYKVSSTLKNLDIYVEK